MKTTSQINKNPNQKSIVFRKEINNKIPKLDWVRFLRKNVSFETLEYFVNVRIFKSTFLGLIKIIIKTKRVPITNANLKAPNFTIDDHN